MSPRRTHYSSSVLLTLKHSPQFNSSKDWIGKLFLEKAIHLKCQKPQCVETPLKTTTLFNFKPKNKGKNLNLSDDTTPANWMWFRRHALLHPSPFTRLQIQQRNFLIYFQEPQIGKDIPSLETQPKRKVSGSGIAPYSTPSNHHRLANAI